MQVYICEKCGRAFKRKDYYQKHLKRKFPCVVKPQKTASHKKFKCQVCMKVFTRKDNMRRHQRTVHTDEDLLTKPVKSASKRRTTEDQNPHCSSKSITANFFTKHENLPNETVKVEKSYRQGIQSTGKLRTHLIEDPPHVPPQPPQSSPDTNSSHGHLSQFHCKYCNRAFTRIDNMKRHLVTCIVRQNAALVPIPKNMLVVTEDEKNMMARDQSPTSQTSQNEQNSINLVNSNNSNCNNHTTNYVTVVNYGDEDFDKLPDKLCKKFIKKGYHCVPEMIEHMNYNESYPMWHNMYVPSQKSPEIMVLTDGAWEMRYYREEIDNIYEMRRDFLIDKFEEMRDELDQRTVDKFERFIDDIPDQKLKSIKGQIRLIMYNKRKAPIATRKRMETQQKVWSIAQT